MLYQFLLYSRVAQAQSYICMDMYVCMCVYVCINIKLKLMIKCYEKKNPVIECLSDRYLFVVWHLSWYLIDQRGSGNVKVMWNAKTNIFKILFSIMVYPRRLEYYSAIKRTK